MGLLDFLNNEGEKKPVTPEQPAAGTDFFGDKGDKAAATGGESYTVVSGDTLSKIANKETIGSNPDRIEVGQVLTLPSL